MLVRVLKREAVLVWDREVLGVRVGGALPTAEALAGALGLGGAVGPPLLLPRGEALSVEGARRLLQALGEPLGVSLARNDGVGSGEAEPEVDPLSEGREPVGCAVLLPLPVALAQALGCADALGDAEGCAGAVGGGLRVPPITEAVSRSRGDSAGAALSEAKDEGVAAALAEAKDAVVLAEGLPRSPSPAVGVGSRCEGDMGAVLEGDPLADGVGKPVAPECEATALCDGSVETEAEAVVHRVGVLPAESEVET